MRIEYLILNLLYRSEAKSKLIAATQQNIVEGLAAEGEKYTSRTIYEHLRKLLKLEYVKNGIPGANAAYTYYITKAGMNWLKEMETEETETEEVNE